MSEYTPQHHTSPSASNDPAAIDAAPTDLVAGDPPVPITVWRTARTEADAGRSIGARLAARLIAAYCRPGEVVVDLTDGHALTRACTASGRLHHPAWFTDAASLIIGPASPAHSTDSTMPVGTDDGENEDDENPPELSAWFGDDLTDPAPRPAAPDADLPADGSLHGGTSLVVARWPLDQTGDAANRIRLAWLLTACQQLLRPGGCLILVVAVPAGAPPVPEDFTPVVQAAAAVRLGYLQHIVAIAADTDGDAFIYHVTDEELLALADTTGQWQAAHLRVHADLLVFSQTEKPAPRSGTRGQQGGGSRG